MKKTLAGGIIALSLVALFAGNAAPVSGLPALEIQAQIRELLTKVASLQTQLGSGAGMQITAAPSPAAASLPAKHRLCSILARNLSRGAQGDDVRGLQEFLSAEGYLSANATGYFGPATASAVARWQASQGISAPGIVGPLTRERIKIWCGGGGVAQERFSATPTRGEAPLKVTFSTWLSGFRPQSIY